MRYFSALSMKKKRKKIRFHDYDEIYKTLGLEPMCKLTLIEGISNESNKTSVEKW